MKYILIIALSLVVGYVAGVQYTYYQARQIKDQIKEATIQKISQKYDQMENTVETYKTKLKEKLNND